MRKDETKATSAEGGTEGGDPLHQGRKEGRREDGDGGKDRRSDYNMASSPGARAGAFLFQHNHVSLYGIGNSRNSGAT